MHLGLGLLAPKKYDPLCTLTTMPMFSGLDSSVVSVNSSKDLSLNLIEIELLQLANAADNTLEAKLGLSSSARITLDVIMMAQHAKSHRKACTDIADQTYQLFNALDGGVKGRAIDINGILRDHITRLNDDLLQIRKTISRFASWWNISRIWKARQKIQKCYEILGHSMQMYLLLLRFSLAQPTPKRWSRDRKRSPGPNLTVPKRQPHMKDRRKYEKLQEKTARRLSSPISQPPHRNRYS
ncbi:hypothetical protein BJ912DRAFT_965689, partial [Pholiota molesta]